MTSDPLSELTRERFGESVWFPTIHPEMPLDDSELTQGVRRRVLREAIDGTPDELEEAV